MTNHSECKNSIRHIENRFSPYFNFLFFKMQFGLQERIRNFFKDLVQESARYNMYINAQKSKIMVVSRQDNISVQVDHEGESLEQVHDFNS